VLGTPTPSGPSATFAATVSYLELPLPTTRQEVVVANAIPLDKLRIPLEPGATAANLAVTLRKVTGETIRLENRAGDIRNAAGRKSLDVGAITKRMLRF
jgi:hypothetical protein